MALIQIYAALYQEYKRILTDRQYEILWLHEIEGLSGKEIAAQMGTSMSSVSRHLQRARAKIRHAIRREQYTHHTQEGDDQYGKL